MKKVSVIVPIYNVESYLKTCINSIVNQSYKNLEIILVDDGSPDNCPKICDEYTLIDKRIKVFHKKNEGVSTTRNYGINYATGDYILFVDSDDYIHEDMIKILVENCESTKSDMSVCSFTKTKNHNSNKKIIINDVILYNKNEAYSQMIKNKFFAGYVWNKLYSKKILDKMKKQHFEEIMIEDFEFNCRYINFCEKICYTKASLYYYYENNNGITGTFKINSRIIKGKNAYDKIIYYYDKYDKIDEDIVVLEALKYEFNLNYKSYVLNKTKKRCYISHDKYTRIINSNVIKLKDKIYILFSYSFPILSSKIKYFINKKRRKKNEKNCAN